MSDGEPEADDEIERYDPADWAQFPYCGARVATQDRTGFAFGTLTEVWRTLRARQIVYFLQYDDGDLRHLSEAEAAVASALARSFDAEKTQSALALTESDKDKESREAEAPPTRRLARRHADAHLSKVTGIRRGFLL